MVKRAHHRSAVRSVLAGTIGTLGALAVSTQAASANHVIVKAGDTIWKIAQQHQTTVSALKTLMPTPSKRSAIVLI
ncbi:MAG: LysM peptidoglycan-binding domain-containing protein [Limosilactobacillus pontis]